MLLKSCRYEVTNLYNHLFFTTFKFASADIIKIDFNGDDTYSIEVAKVDVGNTTEWLPKNTDHNVEFLAGPNMKAPSEKSDLKVSHRVIGLAGSIFISMHSTW